MPAASRSRRGVHSVPLSWSAFADDDGHGGKASKRATYAILLRDLFITLGRKVSKPRSP
jgi:hypothetical protein